MKSEFWYIYREPQIIFQIAPGWPHLLYTILKIFNSAYITEEVHHLCLIKTSYLLDFLYYVYRMKRL